MIEHHDEAQHRLEQQALRNVRGLVDKLERPDDILNSGSPASRVTIVVAIVVGVILGVIALRYVGFLG